MEKSLLDAQKGDSGKRKRLKLAFRILILLLIFSSCNLEEKKLKEDFFKQVSQKSDHKRVINFGNTKFQWHKLFFFDQEYRDNNISSIVGFSWHGTTVPAFSLRLFFADTLRKKGYYFDIRENDKIGIGCLLKEYYTPETAQFYAVSATQENDYIDYFVSPVECADFPEDTILVEFSHHAE